MDRGLSTIFEALDFFFKAHLQTIQPICAVETVWGLNSAHPLLPGLCIVPNSSDPAHSPSSEGAPYLCKGHAGFFPMPRKIFLRASDYELCSVTGREAERIKKRKFLKP